MRRILALTASLLFTLLSTAAVSFAQGKEGVHLAEPAYAKWGRLAMTETRKRYPDAQIVDYLHVGRVNKSTDVAEETFKLWLNRNGRELGVFVRITFEIKTDRVLLVRFQEISQ
ncbi:YqzG/YhdC family protein [Effusibacillus lacus]|uniref:DUF3889 domain-containing protein n=1 Tax=Effusibacillus lacus TaxID=1348429 RepID=A0A292YMI9_9BACL|nr:YqzG/YhdC family protein [Effusibacillus lacus]TCS76588.1 uncharacterized protein DUF3889 [Effusibacillus lacus]GAX90396.1 hypothetical protein EFBL_2023 [Effusibacillus lacus]